MLPEDYDFEAHKELVPVPPGDVSATYADTGVLEANVGFEPCTILRDDLRRFAQWNKSFSWLNEGKTGRKELLRIAFAGTGCAGLSIAAILSLYHELTAEDIISEKVEILNWR